MKTLVLRTLLACTAALLATGCGDGSQPASTSAIDQRIQELFPTDPPFGTTNRDQVRRMMQVPAEEDGPFYMVNLIRHRERAEYPDGRETDLTGAEADGLYGQSILPILLDIGARPVFVGDAELNLISSDGETWDQIGMVRYPSRAKFFEMLEREDFRAVSQHKAAGVEKTLVLVSVPQQAPFPDEFYQVDMSSVPHPPTPDDPPITMAHLLGFHEIAQYEDGRETTLTGREAMALYEQGREQQGVIGRGVRPGLWVDIEGELVGDGRTWSEFRLNNFPSRAAFWDVASVSEEAGIEHRNAAIRDTYTQLVAPFINEWGYR